MQALRVFHATVLAIIAGMSVAAAQEPAFAKSLEELLRGIGAEAVADRQEPQQRFQEICLSLGTPGREAERADACKRMVAKLGPETAKPARLWLLKQLQLLGRAECVDAVAALLDDTDEEVCNAARAALTCNPAPEANARFITLLSIASNPATQIVAIRALGYRRDPASVETLSRFLKGQDSYASVAVEAAEALGTIGGAEAAGVLAAVKSDSRELCQAIVDARLCLAQQMLKEGSAVEAAEIYREFSEPSQPRPVRLAAMTGQLRTAGDRAMTMVLQWLQSGDADTREVAAGHIGEINDPAAMAQLAAELSKLPATTQITLLSVLVVKGDKSAMSAAKLAAKSDDPNVQAAGLAAMARLGDASVVRRLIEVAISDAPTAGQARKGLREASGDGVDQTILDAMDRVTAPVQIILVDVLEDRGTVLAVPTLIHLAQQRDATLRARAIRALAQLAAPPDIPALVDLASKTSKGRERNEVEKAIVSVSNMNNAVAQGDPIMGVYTNAGKAERPIILPILGRFGSLGALKVIKEAMKSTDAEMVDAGVRALCNWPDPSVAEDLLEVAGGSASQAHRVWALRAYVRVITTPAAMPDTGTLKALDKAMHMAGRDEEKQLILSRVASVRSVETLRWVLPYLNERNLAGDASKTIVDLARRKELFTPNRDEFIMALRRVIDANAVRATVERAGQIIQGM